MGASHQSTRKDEDTVSCYIFSVFCTVSSYVYIGPYGICGDKCYSYSTEMCCNGQVTKRKGTKYCCGDGTYDFRKQVCCGGVAIKRSSKYYQYCCGNSTYDYYKQVCCNGSLKKRTSFTQS